MDWLKLAAGVPITLPDPASPFAPQLNAHLRHRGPLDAGPCLNPERQQ